MLLNRIATLHLILDATPYTRCICSKILIFDYKPLEYTFEYTFE